MESEVKLFAQEIFKNGIYFQGSSYDDAWSHAFLVAKAKSRTVENSIFEYLRSSHPATTDALRRVWIKDEEKADNKCVLKSISAYDFVATKVNEH